MREYSGEKPKIVTKIDVESSEIEILFDLIINGLLTQINFALIEYHNKWIRDHDRIKRSRVLEAFVNELDKYCSEITEKGEKFCDFVHVSGDDTSYVKSKFPLPVCSGE